MMTLFWRRWRPVWYWPIFGVLLVLLPIATYRIMWVYEAERALASGDERLALYESTLESAVERFRYLPQVIALTEPVRLLLTNPDDAKLAQDANNRLAYVARAAGADTLFVMNLDGLTLASSNAEEPTSFVGQNYAFRPYFQAAIALGEGRHYAIGATTGRPGYFLASRIDGPEGSIGVAVVKVDLAPMEAEWRRAAEQVGLRDELGVFFLASAPMWRYRPLLPLSAAALNLLTANRQYGSPPQIGAPLATGMLKADALPLITLENGQEVLANRRSLASHGWSLVQLQSVEEISKRALLVAAFVAVALGATGLMLLVLNERRAHSRSRQRAYAELERRVEERTLELRRAQDSLVQSAKLAGLGQGLMGIAHEMAQPLAAMRTTLATLRFHVEAGDRLKALEAASVVSLVTDRVAALSAQLRDFGRPDPRKPAPLDLRDCLEGALSIVAHRLKSGEDDLIDIHLDKATPQTPVMVVGLANRIEQVIVNCLGNAIDSVTERFGLHDTGRGTIGVEVGIEGRTAFIAITDNGVGLRTPGPVTNFEPFQTTKPAGQGLGLGLVISRGIAEDYGGCLELKGLGETGACARLTLPLAAGGPA